uniref:Uncharacterized protein n=1 Tax=Trieres chinensis TaxID=1514140 RepID=A0A7S1Z6A4_TRICV|mmetsp:Transcript_18672/g.37857  ORF Transcript_18672/g.37857 Transcript_18672/m.37857 type:complete len:294 (+) Transcript_18672:69-950(+)
MQRRRQRHTMVARLFRILILVAARPDRVATAAFAPVRVILPAGGNVMAPSETQTPPRPVWLKTGVAPAAVAPRSFCVSSSLGMASPSGIDALPEVVQTATFFGIYAALFAATSAVSSALDATSKSMGLERWRISVVETTLPLILGALYLTAGIGHFSSKGSFVDIYPPPGTWGIWKLPGSAEFHVTWTGAAELLGGMGLIFGGLKDYILDDDDDGSLIINLVKPASALSLFLLTVAVTPANIYMYTHGATMGDTGPLDLSFHYVRFAVQAVLLGLLLTLTKDSFFFAWGDELD